MHGSILRGQEMTVRAFFRFWLASARRAAWGVSISNSGLLFSTSSSSVSKARRMRLRANSSVRLCWVSADSFSSSSCFNSVFFKSRAVFHFGDLFVGLGFGFGSGDTGLLVEVLGLLEQAGLLLLAQGVRDLGVGRVERLDRQGDQLHAKLSLETAECSFR